MKITSERNGNARLLFHINSCVAGFMLYFRDIRLKSFEAAEIFFKSNPRSLRNELHVLRILYRVREQKSRIVYSHLAHVQNNCKEPQFVCISFDKNTRMLKVLGGDKKFIISSTVLTHAMNVTDGGTHRIFIASLSVKSRPEQHRPRTLHHA